MCAGELHHAEVVVEVAFPAGDDATGVVEPGEEAFDFPAPAGAPKRPTVLGARAASAIRGDHLNAVRRHQRLIEAVAVVAPIADQTRGDVGDEARIERGGDEVRLIR